MRCLLINLDARPDRLAMMSEQLGLLGIAFERIRATEPHELPPRDWPDGRVLLTPGELACLDSHRRCWREIAGGDEPVLVIEDDIFVSARLGDALAGLADWPGQADIVRFETRLLPGVLSDRAGFTRGGVRFRRLHSTQYGAAAYIATPAAARLLDGFANDATVAADHLVFDAEEPFFDKFRIYQSDPALAVQGDILAGTVPDAPYHSDLESDRRKRFDALDPYPIVDGRRQITPLQRLGRESRRILRQAAGRVGRVRDRLQHRTLQMIEFDRAGVVVELPGP
ncbi:MAG: glycosyltransferase family 25 protein [Flavobacteriaceae bacterium]